MDSRARASTAVAHFANLCRKFGRRWQRQEVLCVCVCVRVCVCVCVCTHMHTHTARDTDMCIHIYIQRERERERERERDEVGVYEAGVLSACHTSLCARKRYFF